ncbi:MAG: hypothetical protein CSB47_02230 [Proteobacteria bacterium]|nr:MAG: hypothetical protein CSB47_02230 [Pseudomonadota bacterium]
MDRRDFLKYSSLISAAGFMPGIAFSANGRPPQKIVVLVELKGGNDGFNTLVPYRDEAYRRLRPSIRIDERKVLTLGQGNMGMHPHMKGLIKLWNQGDMAWIQGIGYPQGVLSHFRSMDIVTSGSNANQTIEDGWLTHVLPKVKQGLHGISVSRDGSSLGPLHSAKLNSVSMQSPRMFVKQSKAIQKITPVNSTPALAHLTQTQHQLYEVGLQLREKMARSLHGQKRVRSKGVLGHSLESVAQMIIAGIDAPVYKVTQTGFDTHSNQVGRHNNVLYQLDHALSRFASTMKQNGLWDHIVVVTYSEFGRRAAENRGGGTDHGTASAQFVLGGGIRGGLFGQHPNLTRLDSNGNVAYTTDFRRVYATLAQRIWRQGNHPWQGHKPIGFI